MPIKPENQFFKTRSQVIDWLNLHEIKNYTVSDDLTVSVNGRVDLRDKKLKYLPVQFGRVEGSFLCERNSLETLRGSPRAVGRDFSAFKNKLASLEFMPQEIQGNIEVSQNKLTTLDYLPQKIKGYLNVMGNQLSSLKGVPKEIPDTFHVNFNNLKSLEHGPSYVGGNYMCQYNRLENLLFIPEWVGGQLALGNYKNENIDDLSYEEIYNIHKAEMIAKEKEELLKAVATGPTSTNKNLLKI